MIHKILYFSTVLLTIRCIYAVQFMRTVEAFGYPYYKILFSLGFCKDNLLFEDNKIWGSVRLNRIFDIYYKTYGGTKISTVEIRLVVNNTECISVSDTDVGKTEFSAVIVIPTNVGIIFYSLSIFSCNPVKENQFSEDIAVGYLESVEDDEPAPTESQEE